MPNSLSRLKILSKETCAPCKGKSAMVRGLEIKSLKPQIPHWKIIQSGGVKKLQRTFLFKDFNQAMALAIKIGKLANQADHHPALIVEWGKLTVTFWTHKIQGLHRNDFIMAAKVNKL